MGKKKKFKVIQKKMEFEVFDGMQKVSFLSLSEIHLCKKINLRDWKVVGQYFHGIKFIFVYIKLVLFQNYLCWFQGH